MSETTARGTLLRIFVAESDRCCGKPLYEAIVESLRRAPLSGVTVLKAIEGFGSSGVLHTSRAVDSSTNLPVLIEVMETRDKISQFLSTLRSMPLDGLITLESVDLVQFSNEKGGR